MPDDDFCSRTLSRVGWLNTPELRAHDCCTEEKQKTWLMYHQHRTCDDVHISLLRVLEALRGKTLGFFGDSVSGQYFDAFVADAFRRNLSLIESDRVMDYGLTEEFYEEDDMCGIKHKPPRSMPANVGGETTYQLTPWERPGCRILGTRTGRNESYLPLCANTWNSQVVIPSTNTTIRRYWFDRNLTNQTYHNPKVRPPFRSFIPCIQQNGALERRLEAALEGSDVLVVNFGLYYNDEEPNAVEDYEASLRYAVRRLLQQSRARPSQLLLFRQTTPQHFSSRDGTYTKVAGAKPSEPVCTARNYSRQSDWRNEMLARVVSAHPALPDDFVLPVEGLLGEAHVMHRNRLHIQFPAQVDCTHYCNHQQLWDALFDGLYRRIVNRGHGWSASLDTRRRGHRPHAESVSEQGDGPGPASAPSPPPRHPGARGHGHAHGRRRSAPPPPAAGPSE